MKSLFTILSSLLLPLAMLQAQTVESYIYPHEAETSEKYEVSVGNRQITVLQTPEPDLAIFGADGTVTVKIKCLGFSPDSVIVRPIAKNYIYSLDGDVITLSLKTGDRVSVEPNYSQQKPLFIFVNPLEARAVERAKKDDNTIFYKAGEIHHLGQIPMRNGKNVYIQGGAIVEGYIDTRDGYSGYKLEGCGILDGSLADGVTFPKKNAVRIENCNRLTMRNLTILNMDYWTTYIVHSDHSLLENVKVVATFSHLANGTGCENDGIDICGCQDVMVKGCFAYCHDDAFCIKSSTPTCTRLSSKNYFEDCVAWNIDSGNSFEIGYRISGGVDDCHFKNIYAIHSGHRPNSYFRRSGLSIHAGSDGTLSNLTYDNVWIEDPQEHSININVFKTPYKTYEWAPGKIKNVKINNLHILKPAPNGGTIKGYDPEHMTTDIAFTNIYYLGEKVSNYKDADFREIKFTSNVSIDGVVMEEPVTEDGKNEAEPKRIILLGDSTCASNGNVDGTSYRGWGQVFPLFFNPGKVDVMNFAKGGASTKTFRSKGYWDKAKKEMKEGTIVLLQFGHNDENPNKEERGTSPEEYKENLRTYVREILALKAQPVILTPIMRRRYTSEGKAMRTGGGCWNHVEYSPKVFEVASEFNIPLIEGEKISEEWLNTMTPDQAKEYFVWFNPGAYAKFPDGKKDDTHLNQKGAYEISGRFAKALCEIKPELKPFLLDPEYSRVEGVLKKIKTIKD